MFVCKLSFKVLNKLSFEVEACKNLVTRTTPHKLIQDTRYNKPIILHAEIPDHTMHVLL